MAAITPKTEIQQLIARSQAARSQITHAVSELRAKLDGPARVRQSMRSHPSAWLAGAAATGLFASRLLFRRKKKTSLIPTPTSIPIFLIKTLASATAPALKILLLAQIKSYINRTSNLNTPNKNL